MIRELMLAIAIRGSRAAVRVLERRRWIRMRAEERVLVARDVSGGGTGDRSSESGGETASSRSWAGLPTIARAMSRMIVLSRAQTMGRAKKPVAWRAAR